MVLLCMVEYSCLIFNVLVYFYLTINYCIVYVRYRLQFDDHKNVISDI